MNFEIESQIGFSVRKSGELQKVRGAGKNVGKSGEFQKLNSIAFKNKKKLR